MRSIRILSLALLTSAAIAPAATEPPRDALERKLMAASARLRVESAGGVSRGTGTVIDCRQGEALILTCGHIFRDSEGKGRVEVDLFATGGPRGVAGQVVAWDLRRDLALVSIFTDAPLEAVRVGAADRRVAPGESVVTVGCNGGADPTIHHSRITAVDKYLGPANVQVAGQPVQGRSGGGLFAIDGTLIGVCNAADPADNEGLFAALPSIHEQLEEAGLAFVYRNVYPSAGADALAAGGSAHVPAMPDAMPPVAFDRRDRADAVPTASTGAVDGPEMVDAAAETNAAPPAAAALSAPPAPAPRAAVAPPAASAALSPGEQALLDHVRRHEGKAEVICRTTRTITNPTNAIKGRRDCCTRAWSSPLVHQALSLAINNWNSPPSSRGGGTSWTWLMPSARDATSGANACWGACESAIEATVPWPALMGPEHRPFWRPHDKSSGSRAERLLKG